MIEAISEPLPQDRQDKIRLWLTGPEAQWVEEVVSGRLAECIAMAGNSSMEQAVGVLGARDIPPTAKEQIAIAAGLQIFLATLRELRGQETFSKVTLKIN